MITVFVKLTSAGADTGPTFELRSDGETPAFSSVLKTISKAGLLAGTYLDVEDDTTVIRVISLGVCNSIKDIAVEAVSSVTVPTVTTTSVTAITNTTASTGGNVTADGGTTVTERGVVYSTSTTPTTANSKTINGSGTGVFTSALTALIPDTTYYVRAYATNAAGTSYGNQVSFSTTGVTPTTSTTTSTTTAAPTTTTTTTVAPIEGVLYMTGGPSASNEDACAGPGAVFGVYLVPGPGLSSGVYVYIDQACTALYTSSDGQYMKMSRYGTGFWYSAQVNSQGMVMGIYTCPV